MDKPFRTIDEQISILRKRGLIVEDDDRMVLEREGYYSVVNGYKDPFIDKWATGNSGDDRYISGTSFSDLHKLFVFDRDLRSIFMRYIAIAEASLKTICSYKFTEAHQKEVNPYLNLSNYAKRSRTKFQAEKLIKEFEDALYPRDRKGRRIQSKKDYLRHYVEDHGGEVPLWVLMNNLMLGQAYQFFDYQNDAMKNSIAHRYSDMYAETHTKEKRITSSILVRSYGHIKDFRNICAHDERLYCSKVGKAKDISVARLIRDLELVIPKDSYTKMIGSVLKLTLKATSEIDGIQIDLPKRMGMKTIEELLSI